MLSGFILCHVYLASVGDGPVPLRRRSCGRGWRGSIRLHLATLAGVGLMAGAAAGWPAVSVDPNILSGLRCRRTC